MTITLKEARNALWVLQQFLYQLSEQEQKKGVNNITEKQKQFIKKLCKRKGRPEPENLDLMTKEEASKLIDELKEGT